MSMLMDPVLDEAEHTLLQDQRQREWEAEQYEKAPFCRICGEKLFQEDIVDLTDCGDENMVYHPECLRSLLRYDTSKSLIGDELFEYLEADRRRRI